MKKRPLKEWVFDIFFSDYKLWRRLRGGTWYEIRIIPLQDCVTFWVRQPLESEIVINKETYGISTTN